MSDAVREIDIGREFDAESTDDVGLRSRQSRIAGEDRIGFQPETFADKGFEMRDRIDRVRAQAGIEARPAFDDVIAGEWIEAEKIVFVEFGACAVLVRDTGRVSPIGLIDRLSDRL